jgi:NAD+ synthase (glutamine-hydrolysing)
MNTAVCVAMVQDNFLVGDIIGNADKIIRHAQTAHQQGAALVVFPELALVGYPPEDLLLRRGFIDLVESELARICASVHEIDMVFGLPRLHNGRLYNAAHWIRAGQIIASYHKQCLPNYSVFDERRYFYSGKDACVVELDGVKFGLAICEDVWETAPVIEAKSAGAEVMLILNASPFHLGKYHERVAVLTQRAKKSGLGMLYLNMIGGQDELVFDGESLVVNAQGGVIYRAAAFAPATEYVDVSANELRPHSDQQRADLPEAEAVYCALVLAIKDFVHNNGFSGVVIGLSGGVDSALTLALAVDALGADNVQAVMMPSRYTADMSVQDAEAEASAFGVHYDVIAIETVFESFLAALQPVFAGREPDVTEENIQARCRGVMLMAISNKTGHMVLTTGNKSEMAVGYATLYGDMSGGFAPLKDVSKTLVYKLCHYRNSLSNVIPERVLTRAPSAELRHDQVDQDSLPDYAVLDRILELSVERDVPRAEIIAEGIDAETVDRVLAMVRRNEYKRRQAAPGVRITKRAFGRDRRYPITSGYETD